MERSQYSSRLLDNAVNQFATLPGIGRRTALRLVLHLLREDKNDVLQFVDAVRAVRSDICYCKLCHNISDNEICDICANAERDHRTICVVENIRDVMAIENTHQYRGVYHVLGGVISPMDGIGPDDLNISSLEERLVNGEADEVILALSTTLEGDTTNLYLYKRLDKYGVNITTIARGVAVGDELEYADEVTLGRSIINRVPFNKTIAV
ncbi:MAG: recombination protein RecR [Bacteroidales bacterium]|nr:recombination protein RecR [Bacteroidales bacterium]